MPRLDPLLGLLPTPLDKARRRWSDIIVTREDRGHRQRTGQADIGEPDKCYVNWIPLGEERGRGRFATRWQAFRWRVRWVLKGVPPPTIEELNDDPLSANYLYRGPLK